MQIQIKSNRTWKAPFHYTSDSTGIMQHVIGKFREGLELSESEEKYLYWYVWQYVDAFEVKPREYRSLYAMKFSEMRDFVVSVLPSYGINPF
jgi:hypothetical protein